MQSMNTLERETGLCSCIKFQVQTKTESDSSLEHEDLEVTVLSVQETRASFLYSKSKQPFQHGMKKNQMRAVMTCLKCRLQSLTVHPLLAHEENYFLMIQRRML